MKEVDHRDTAHFREMEAEILGVRRLLADLEKDNPRFQTFICAGQFKLLTIAATLGGLADDLDAMLGSTKH